MFYWHACIFCTRSELCASTSVCFDVDMMFWTLLKSKEEEKIRRRWTTFIGFLTCQTLKKLFLFTWMTSLSKIWTATVKYSIWSPICHIYDIKVWQILAATLTAASHDWKACELSLRSVLGCRKQCGVNRTRKKGILCDNFANYRRHPTWIILFYHLLPSNPVGNTTSS